MRITYARLLLVGAAFFILASCSDSRDTERKVGAKAVNGMTEVVKSIQLDKPAEASVLSHLAQMFYKVLSLSPEDLQNNPAVVTAGELQAQPAAAVAKSQQALKEDTKALDDARSGNNWWAWLLTGGTVVAGIASRFIPGVGPLVSAGFDAVAAYTGKRQQFKQIQARANELETQTVAMAGTIQGSVAGRYGLKKLDSLLGSDIKEAILKATGGKVDTLEGAFTHVAKNHVVDNDAIHHESVKKVLDQAEHDMVTVNGVPAAADWVTSS